jgi:hypothetical protein
MLAQVLYFGYSIGEISCPARYFEGASSINFRRSVVYGVGVLKTSIQFFFQRVRLTQNRLFSEHGRRLVPGQADQDESVLALPE